MTFEGNGASSGYPSIDLEALRAAGFIGTWASNVEAGVSVFDHGAALVMAGDAGLAGKPLSLGKLFGCIHEDDRDWVFERIARSRRTGGPFSAEFRVRALNGEVRYVLDRGTTTPDSQGRMWGRGVFIDTTEGNRGRFRAAEPEALPPIASDPLEVAARHCIATRESIVRTGNPVLRLLADTLLLEIGRSLSQAR